MKNRGGQLLVEAVIALTLVTIGLLGIFSLLSNSFGMHRVATNQYIASTLAAEGIEVVKNIIDRNALLDGVAWNSGISNGSYEVDYTSEELTAASGQILKFEEARGYGYWAGGEKTIFTRTVVVENLSDDEIKVNSIVEWRDRSRLDMEVNVEDRFFNWRQEEESVL
ncbi:MAG: hypothetical protein HYS87_00255 [Candidatus Colwellbacteria bacterium]|nr:hypothetical protein [Candidatus Colwellbacteria bacterium]